MKLYDVDFAGATNVNGGDSYSSVKKLRTAEKTVLLDLDDRLSDPVSRGADRVGSTV
jgi:hypothetical protein